MSPTRRPPDAGPAPVAASSPTADRLVAAAFDVFTERGFDAATVDDITARAGVSRRTFFRHFRTKEDVIFPDHDRLLAKVAEHLDTHRTDPPVDALCAAVRIVFADYVRAADISVRRYALTRTVPALRERELSSVHRYQRLFVDYLRDRVPGGDPLHLEIVAAAVVVTHNATLRSWLRAPDGDDALRRLDGAFDTLHRALEPLEPDTARTRSSDAGTAVAVFSTTAPVAEVLAALQRQLGTR